MNQPDLIHAMCPTCVSPSPRLRADTAPGVPCPDPWHQLPPAEHVVMLVEGCRCVLTDDGISHHGCPHHRGIPVLPSHLGGMMLARALSAVNPHSVNVPDLLAQGGAYLAYMAGTLNAIDRGAAERLSPRRQSRPDTAYTLKAAADVLLRSSERAHAALGEHNAKAEEPGPWADWVNNWLGGEIGEHCGLMSPEVAVLLANLLDSLSRFASTAEPTDLEAAVALARYITDAAEEI